MTGRQAEIAVAARDPDPEPRGAKAARELRRRQQGQPVGLVGATIEAAHAAERGDRAHQRPTPGILGRHRDHGPIPADAATRQGRAAPARLPGVEDEEAAGVEGAAHAEEERVEGRRTLHVIEHLAHRDHRVARGHRGGRQTADREAGGGNVAPRETHHVRRRVQPERPVTRRHERPRRGTRPAAELDHEASRDAGAAQQGQQARRRAAREVRVARVVYEGEVATIRRPPHGGSLALVWHVPSMRRPARARIKPPGR